MFKILLNKSKCLGCAYCVEVSPALFKINLNDGKVDLIGSKTKNGIQSIDLNEIFLEEAREAATICPTKIIEVRK